jgi:alkylated DNA repair dioxygenase AlkB
MERKLIAEGGIIDYDVEFMSPEESATLFSYLQQNVAWEQLQYTNFKDGKKYPQPRLTAWFADDESMSYSYSGVTQVVQPWIPELTDLKSRIEHVTGVKYNSVLLNYYRDGKDSVGLHADNEKELGINPNIASISLGSTREFLLVQQRTTHPEGLLDYQEYQLTAGSLLVMSGTTQKFWKHSIPKVAKAGPRINLTYRYFHSLK